MLEPSLKAGAGRFEQLELDRPTGRLLRDRGSRPDPAAADKLTDSDFHDIAAAQLAVDGEVEKRAVPGAPFPVEPEPMAQTCCGVSARFAPTMRPVFQGLRSRIAGLNSEYPMFVFFLAGMAAGGIRGFVFSDGSVLDWLRAHRTDTYGRIPPFADVPSRKGTSHPFVMAGTVRKSGRVLAGRRDGSPVRRMGSAWVTYPGQETCRPGPRRRARPR